MRISDWSSDVCSSDLGRLCHRPALPRREQDADAARARLRRGRGRLFGQQRRPAAVAPGAQAGGGEPQAAARGNVPPRVASSSEERRGGKEGVSKCRSRWAPQHEKKKKLKTKT